MTKTFKIILVGGGTLGHILPLLSVAKSMKNKGYKLYFIATKGGLEKKYLSDNLEYKKLFEEVFYLDMIGLKRKLTFSNVKTVIKYFKCKKEAKKIFKKLNPDLVIGMGGYISGVVIKKASSLNIKTIIHEQNSVLGLGNKMNIKNVDKILLTFPIEKVNGKVIGNPRITDIYKNYKSIEEKNTILIVGGSRGSKVINDTILANIERLVKYKITLITGSLYYEKEKERINNITNKYHNIKVYPFINNLITYMQKATIVISRGGSTTLNEILGLKKVAIIIPSPNVTSNHQEKNTFYLASRGECLMVKEENIEEELLIKINQIMLDSKLREEIKTNITFNTSFNALYDFNKEVEELLCKK